MAENGSPVAVTPRQAELIVSTWDLVKTSVGLDQAGIIMFLKLFELAPDLQDLFPFKGTKVSEENEGLKQHGVQVMESVDGAIELLKKGDLEELSETLLELGIVHNMNSVKVESFAPVGQALIHTLATGLGDKFTDEVKDAWVTLYKIVQELMMKGMDEGLDA